MSTYIFFYIAWLVSTALCTVLGLFTVGAQYSLVHILGVSLLIGWGIGFLLAFLSYVLKSKPSNTDIKDYEE